jgi:hypothetical protein
VRVLKIILLVSLFAGLPGTVFGAFRTDFFDSLQENIQQIQQNAGTASTTTTSIQVRSNTGGNSAGGGTISTGNASATVQVKETINGASSTPVEINISVDGEEKKIEVEVTSGNKKATSTSIVKRQISEKKIIAQVGTQNIITKTLHSIKSLFKYVLSFF